jgi:hypothetical protein
MFFKQFFLEFLEVLFTEKNCSGKIDFTANLKTEKILLLKTVRGNNYFGKRFSGKTNG